MKIRFTILALIAAFTLYSSANSNAQFQKDLERKYVKNMPKGSKLTILEDLLLPMGQSRAFVGQGPKNDAEMQEQDWVMMVVEAQDEVRRIRKDRPFVINKIDTREEAATDSTKAVYYVDLYFEGKYDNDHFTVHTVEEQPTLQFLRKTFEITLAQYKDY